jgi:hypothetical protein
MGCSTVPPRRLEGPATWTRSRDPLVALGVGAALVVALDAGRLARGSPESPWLVAEAVVAACALFHARQGQVRLRQRGLLAVAAVFQAAMVAIYLAIGDLPGRSDDLYAEQGQMLLDGSYPESEYPTGAVLLFALETAVGGGSAHAANAIVMVAFQVLVIAGVWAMRTPWSAWLAALIAFWLARNCWGQTFDLDRGARRGSSSRGAAVLGREALLGLGGGQVGTGALGGRPRVASRAEKARRPARSDAASVFADAPVPRWSRTTLPPPTRTRPDGRSSSLCVPPLHWLGQASVVEDFTHAADVPSWADPAASMFQLVVVAATLVLAGLVRGRLRSAIAVAALAPIVFLVTNRVFSAQFLRSCSRPGRSRSRCWRGAGASSWPSARWRRPRARRTRSSTRLLFPGR